MKMPVNKKIVAAGKSYGFEARPGHNQPSGYITSPTSTNWHYSQKISNWIDQNEDDPTVKKHFPKHDGNGGNVMQYHARKGKIHPLAKHPNFPADALGYLRYTKDNAGGALEESKFPRATDWGLKKPKSQSPFKLDVERTGSVKAERKSLKQQTKVIKEISSDVLKNYISKATNDVEKRSNENGKIIARQKLPIRSGWEDNYRKINRRKEGVGNALKRLTEAILVNNYTLAEQLFQDLMEEIADQRLMEQKVIASNRMVNEGDHDYEMHDHEKDFKDIPGKVLKDHKPKKKPRFTRAASDYEDAGPDGLKESFLTKLRKYSGVQALSVGRKISKERNSILAANDADKMSNAKTAKEVRAVADRKAHVVDRLRQLASRRLSGVLTKGYLSGSKEGFSKNPYATDDLKKWTYNHRNKKYGKPGHFKEESLNETIGAAITRLKKRWNAKERKEKLSGKLRDSEELHHWRAHAADNRAKSEIKQSRYAKDDILDARDDGDREAEKDARQRMNKAQENAMSHMRKRTSEMDKERKRRITGSKLDFGLPLPKFKQRSAFGLNE